MIRFHYRQGSRLVGEYDVLARPRTITAGFFGLNSQDWPVRAVTSGGNGTTAPSFRFGTFGTHDCSALHWAALHPSDGVFNWAAMDALVAEMQTRQDGSVLFSLYGTPTWLAQPSQAGVSAPYGHLGGGSYPTDLSKLVQFCTALMTRYNGGGDRNIKYVQLWNEPENSTPFDGVASFNEFWFGTATQFVDTIATAYAALKAADPGIVCLSPGTYSAPVFTTWNNSQGPITGKFGRECYDAVAGHAYHGSPNNVYEGYGPIETINQGGLRRMRVALEDSGNQNNLDQYVTEWGIDSASYAASPKTQAFMGQTPEYRATFYTRLFVNAALRGYEVFAPFSYGNTFGNCAGNLADDPLGIELGWERAYTALVGKTIVGGTCDTFGVFRVRFSDGTVFTA